MRSMAALAALAGCASSSLGALRFHNAPAVWQVDDRREVARPAARPFMDLLYYLDVFSAERVPAALALPTAQRAADVNALDEVPDSTWFTNRIGIRGVALDEIRRAGGDGASPVGPWSVLGTKIGGTEPGLLVADARGVTYLMKFDAPGAPDMETGADVVVQKLLWTLGYHTPVDTIAVVHRDDLVPAPGATVRDVFGRARPMTARDLETTLARADRRPDGAYRTMVSRFLPGAPLGGTPRAGVRDDDPNDRIRHEDRRSIRAQAVFFAWLDHTDINESNTLDMWGADSGRHHVRHYLVDFGKALGVFGWSEVIACDGYARTIDLGYAARSLAALGLWTRPWEGADGARIRGIGRFEVAHFDPLGWTDRYPYPAFDRLDDSDGLWAAKTLMRFTRDQLRAAVDEGRYADPAATSYLVATLVARQRRIGRAWFERVNPLDQFRVAGDALCFDDLLLTYFRDDRPAHYAARAFDFAGAPTGWRARAGAAASTCLAGIAPGRDHDGYVIVELVTVRGGAERPAVRVHLALDPASHALRVIGIRRAAR